MTDLDQVWRQERARVLATLIRLFGDFDLAEEALHEAFVAASERWPVKGLPNNPFAWLVSAGRFRMIDQLRRQKRVLTVDLPPEAMEEPGPDWGPDWGKPDWGDDRLRLIFTCCHPALAPEAQVALTLRTVCGLTTEEIARAFLIRTPAMAQRIVRAKARIRAARLAYEIPEACDLPARLQPVLQVIYLVFNEGYLSQAALRPDLSGEAIRLCRLLADLCPDGEVFGLLGLMLCHESRRQARGGAGALIGLEAQDRSLWDRDLIAQGQGFVARAFASGQIGAYALQGAIAAVHAAAARAEATDWAEIMGLYGVLARLLPSPVVQLNQGVAVAMVRGPEAGLALIDPLGVDLADYRLFHLARADLLGRLGRGGEAAAALARALDLSHSDAERQQVEALQAKAGGAGQISIPRGFPSC